MELGIALRELGAKQQRPMNPRREPWARTYGGVGPESELVRGLGSNLRERVAPFLLVKRASGAPSQTFVTQLENATLDHSQKALT